MDIRERISKLSSGEKLGLGLLALFFGGKAVEGLGKVLLFVVWLGAIFAFIAFCLFMAWVTGGA